MAKDNVTLTHTPYGDEWRCDAGQALEPIGCDRHREHYRCRTCEGFYGVPHDGIHSGPNAHPNWGTRSLLCACRPCQNSRAGVSR